ncbi:MAG: ATP-binding protein [Gammaproteobacteria bacterium]
MTSDSPTQEATTPHVPRRYPLLDRRHEHWLLASMLLVLHATIDAGFDSALSRALMITHLGLFFLWQPIWQKDQRLQLRAVVLVAVLVGAIIVTLSWWTVFAWIVVLIGLVAGRSFTTRQERYVYLVSLAFLVTELLVECAAELFLGAAPRPAIAQPFRIGLYLLPLALYAIPPITVPPREPFPVDFFRGISFALLTALLAVFSALITFRWRIDYPFALVITLIALGLVLLFLGWLASPGVGGGFGLLAVWEKSVLNIGTPFETWLGNIANLAAQQGDADAFLEAAVEELNDIPWVSGVTWESSTSRGMCGGRTRNRLEVDTGELLVALHTERSFSTALLIHCRLLIQVLGHFYAAKRRENKEAGDAHLRAIYETGARVTHDIKNLLQSLNTMAGALQTATTPEQEHRGFNLLKRRLPDLGRRLQRALEKLERPAASQSEQVSAAAWCQNLGVRLAAEGIAFDAELVDPARGLPRDCFDSVVDNLLDNALNKLAAGQASKVAVAVRADAGGVICEVSDDGRAITPTVVRRLFREPVDSQTGHGIGLYQAARLADLAGCALTLANNVDGAVTFRIHCPA